MPTITFSLKDLQQLVGKDLSLSEVDTLVEYGKGELESYDKDDDEVTVNFDDTNLPYLWSVEGVARMVKGILGIQKGIQPLKIGSGTKKIIVDASVKSIRPFIGGFIATGKKVDDYLIKQFIQLQDKLDESFGKRRSKVAIGIYSYEKIAFPIHYKATDPSSVTFTPLQFKKKMTQAEILEEHPKGKEYGWILDGMKKYPLLVDDKGEVLSFTPIINSDFTGKVQVGDDHLVIEATGTDEEAMQLCINIFAYAFADRGFTIESLEIDYGNRKIHAPFLFQDKMKITPDHVSRLTGLSLSKREIIKLLQRAGHDATSSLTVSLPAYRKDILHPYDLVEDIAITYGYNKIPEKPLTSYTIGEKNDLIGFRDTFRELVVGLGFQEVLSPYLSNKKMMGEKMLVTDDFTVEIANPMSETYAALRSWLLPILLDFLSHNKHVEYPQKVFEAGTVAVKKNEKVEDYERIALVSAHDKAGYTELRAIVDYLLSTLGCSCEIMDVDHDSFLPGRVGRVIVEGKKVGYVGEIHPSVIEGHGLEVPVVALELNLGELYLLTKKTT